MLWAPLAADSARLPGAARPGNPGSDGVISSIGVTNKLLLQERQYNVAATLNHIAGICLAIVLLTYQVECLGGALQAAAYIQKYAVEEQVKWLMGAPADPFHTCPDLAHMFSPLAQPACTSSNAEVVTSWHLQHCYSWACNLPKGVLVSVVIKL